MSALVVQVRHAEIMAALRELYGARSPAGTSPRPTPADPDESRDVTESAAPISSDKGEL